MTQPQLRLDDCWECFEGIVPAVTVTAARDGTPNVAYISHVFLIDEGHVALSNQFMSKTVRNVHENPRLQAVVVHPVNGRQLVLDLMFDRQETAGPVFDRMALCLDAVAAHLGMDKVMRLRSADIYRVLHVEAQEIEPAVPQDPCPDPLPYAAALALDLARMDDLDRAIDLTMDGLHRTFGLAHCTLFLADPALRVLTAIAGRGHDRTGAGAEVAWGEGVIGMVAAKALGLRLSCIGRSFHYLRNVRFDGASDTDPARHIPLPGLEAPRSLLAVPMMAGGELRGLIHAEAAERMAFSPRLERAVALVAAQLGALVALTEAPRGPDSAGSGATVSRATACPERTSDRQIQVRHYAFDDSVFIGADYVIKGLPGRLLWRMLGIHAQEGRFEFTNREFRLDPALKLPAFKDNLETRLLLLRRRLDENDWPIRLSRTGRGRVTLMVEGSLNLTESETLG